MTATLATVSELEKFIDEQDIAARTAQRQRDAADAEEKARRLDNLARNEQLLTEFISRMRELHASLTIIEVHESRSTTKKVRIGWFSTASVEVIETAKIGSLSFWPGPSDEARFYVCPDRLVFWLHGDSYMGSPPWTPTSMSANELAGHREARDETLARTRPEGFAANLALVYRDARP